MDEVSYKCEAFARSGKIQRGISFIHKASLQDIRAFNFLPVLIAHVVEASSPSSREMEQEQNTPRQNRDDATLRFSLILILIDVGSFFMSSIHSIYVYS